MTDRDRAWAERFLAEWKRPWFGEDRFDAVALVQRAAAEADRPAALTPDTERGS